MRPSAPKASSINVFKYVLLIFSAFVALVPIVSCINTAFKTEEEYAATNVMTLPENWLNFDNFVTAWQQADMGHAFLNSFIILVCVLAGSVMISSMLAYVLNRFKFPGNGLIRNLFTIATLIPGIAAQVTVYQIMTSLHLVNSMPGYIILMMGTDVITIYIFLQFFENLSVSLDESAILGRLHLLRRLFQDPAAAAQARCGHLCHPQGRGHLQRVLHGQPVPAGQDQVPGGLHLAVRVLRPHGAASTTTSVPACSSPSSPH